VHYEQKTVIFAHVNIERERETKMRTLLKRKNSARSQSPVCVQEREEKGSSSCVYTLRVLSQEREDEMLT